MFDWVAILRGNSVNINFELYPAEAVGEEYNEYIYSLEKMVKIFNKKPSLYFKIFEIFISFVLCFFNTFRTIQS